MMLHVTTKQHYEKYAALCDLHGVRVRNDSTLFNSVDFLMELYKEDKHLNNIPLKKFDAIALHLPIPRSISLSERVCMLKHSLFYDVLGLTPEYVER